MRIQFLLEEVDICIAIECQWLQIHSMVRNRYRNRHDHVHRVDDDVVSTLLGGKVRSSPSMTKSLSYVPCRCENSWYPNFSSGCIDENENTLSLCQAYEHSNSNLYIQKDAAFKFKGAPEVSRARLKTCFSMTLICQEVPYTYWIKPFPIGEASNPGPIH